MNRKLLYYMNEYCHWFLWNFLIPGIPLAAIIIVFSLTVGYSSFLSYCFTSLAVIYYLFDRYVRNQNDGIAMADSLKSTTIVVMFLFIAYFILYNLLDVVKTVLTEHIIAGVTIPIVLIVVLVFFLNRPLIKRHVDERIQRQKRARMDKIEEQVKDMRPELEEEGLS